MQWYEKLWAKKSSISSFLYLETQNQSLQVRKLKYCNGIKKESTNIAHRDVIRFFFIVKPTSDGFVKVFEYMT